MEVHIPLEKNILKVNIIKKKFRTPPLPHPYSFYYDPPPPYTHRKNESFLIRTCAAAAQEMKNKMNDKNAQQDSNYYLQTRS